VSFCYILEFLRKTLLSDPIAVGSTKLLDEWSDLLNYFDGCLGELATEPCVIVREPTQWGPPHEHEQHQIPAMLGIIKMPSVRQIGVSPQGERGEFGHR